MLYIICNTLSFIACHRNIQLNSHFHHCVRMPSILISTTSLTRCRLSDLEVYILENSTVLWHYIACTALSNFDMQSHLRCSKMLEGQPFCKSMLRARKLRKGRLLEAYENNLTSFGIAHRHFFASGLKWKSSFLYLLSFFLLSPLFLLS